MDAIRLNNWLLRPPEACPCHGWVDGVPDMSLVKAVLVVTFAQSTVSINTKHHYNGITK